MSGKMEPLFLPLTLQMLTDFHSSFIDRLSSKFSVKK